MRQSSIIILTVLVVQAYSAPQFITFSEGKLGVNFGGYHAGVGLGGAAGGKTAGGLFAEAGTPFGPAAKAGLGGAVDGNSGTAGGLYAAATAGGNVNAAAGLGGAVAGGKSVGGGFSAAEAGGKSATAVLGGESGASGSSGFSISAHKSIEVPTTIVKEISVVPVEEVRPVHKNVYGEAKLEAANEITSSANAGVDANAHVNVHVNAQPEFVKEVHAEPAPVQTVYVRKHKPHRHHVHKTAYVGGWAGIGGAVAPPETKTVVYKTVQPIEKRVDVDVEAHGGGGATISEEHYGPEKEVSYRKEIVVSHNANAKPNTFFQDIFNIPISTLKAVSGFLTNTAENTGVSVQKSATFKAGGYSGFSGNAGYSGHSGYYKYY